MENIKREIFADKTSYDFLIKKYESIKGIVEKEIQDKCREYSCLTKEQLSKRGFENGIKQAHLDCVKDFVALVDKEYDMEKLILITSKQKENIDDVIRTYFDKSDLTKQILHIQPIHYDRGRLWWFWDKQNFKWSLTDETDVILFVKNLSIANTIKIQEKGELIESLRQEGRMNMPKPIKKSWIQFNDTIIDFETGEEFKATPEYFVTNPIPYKLHDDKFFLTPNMDKIFEEWVGEKNVQTLYEILAYCLIPDYPIHRLFCFIGEGLNGKSCFLRLLKKFIGEENVTSTELDTLLNSRFEVTRLHKKLVCIMGETNFSEMSKTSIIKKLTGQDMIGFEYKNKNPFESENYAKILIATNNLPTTTDKTIGFYRRWLIIDFPNRFSEKKDILSEIPEEEYEMLTVKCLMILKDLLTKREFTNEGTIEERAKKYEDKSDPLEKFMKEYTLDEPDGHIWKFEFEKKLNAWCKENRFRVFSEMAISKKMREKGITDGRIISDWFIDGEKKQLRAWLGVKFKS
jgi:P4 family phage/plasmid primase-like protien